MHPALKALASLLLTGIMLASAPGSASAADKKGEKKPADPKAKAPETKAPAPATNAVSLVVEFPKSAFNSTATAGRDPFFPTSKRRLPKAPEVVKPPTPPTPAPTPNGPPRIEIVAPVPLPGAGTNTVAGTTNAPPPDLIGSANLSLRGIIGNQLKRRATVHTGVKSYDFLKGEEMLIRLPNNKQLKVRCLDIGDRSAVFQADGETQTKELFLREGL